MRKTNRGAIAGLAMATAILIGASSAASGALVFDLSNVVSGATPGEAPPWLRATITQVNANQVDIKMDAIALSLSPTIEAVKDWAFNLNSAINVASITATEVARSGSFNPSPINALSAANGYAGFTFDFDFDFATAGGGAATRFTDGDSLTMRLTRAAGLSESDFNVAVFHNGQNSGLALYSGAHIITIEGGGSAFVGAPVPEPSTYIAGGLLLIPVLVQLRRWKRAA